MHAASVPTGQYWKCPFQVSDAAHQDLKLTKQANLYCKKPVYVRGLVQLPKDDLDPEQEHAVHCMKLMQETAK